MGYREIDTSGLELETIQIGIQDILIFEPYRFSLALVCAGLSDSDYFTQQSLNYEPSESTILIYGWLAKYFQKLGLVTTILIEEPNPHSSISILFAKDKQKLDELERIFRDNIVDSQLNGRLLGIPQTAIDAFPSHVLRGKQVPTEISSRPEYPYLTFRLSQDHYLEEWQYFLNQLKIVHQCIPELADILNLP